MNSMQHVRALGAHYVPPHLAIAPILGRPGKRRTSRSARASVVSTVLRSVVVAALVPVVAAREACIGSVTAVHASVDGRATVDTAILTQAIAVAVGPYGDVFYSTTQYNSLLQILGDGTVAFVVGNNSGVGVYDPTSEGALAASASIATPDGIHAMPNGDLLLADKPNRRVWRVFAANATIRTFYAGAPSVCGENPAAAVGVMWPIDVDADAAGNVYVLDRHHSRIVRVAAADGIGVGVCIGHAVAGGVDCDVVACRGAHGLETRRR